MPTTAEISAVVVGLALCILCLIAFPIVAVICRHLRGRESQIRRWGPANPVLAPPCYCYLTVWVELCPCLEKVFVKILPQDESCDKAQKIAIVSTDAERPLSAELRPQSSTSQSPSNQSQEFIQPLKIQTENETVNQTETDDAVTPDNDSIAPIVTVSVAKEDCNDGVLDRGHVNLAMVEDESS